MKTLNDWWHTVPTNEKAGLTVLAGFVIAAISLGIIAKLVSMSGLIIVHSHSLISLSIVTRLVTVITQ